MDLIHSMLAGDVRALARLMSLVELGWGKTPDLMQAIGPRLGQARIIGITGPPGAGKSTLVTALVQHVRQRRKTVGILAVDPSSPISGGAVLGDRIRMMDHTLDKGVFIRSLSTTGARGGLSLPIRVLIRLLDAFGKDFIFVETVGVGQIEIDIRNVAETTVLVLVPEAGDAVQSLKAGIMEIADIFVVNKADREGAETLKGILLEMTHLKKTDGTWMSPVISCQAHTRLGVDALWSHIEEHLAYVRKGSSDVQLRKSQQREVEFVEILTSLLHQQISQTILSQNSQLLNDVKAGKKDPYDVAIQVMRTFLSQK